MAKRTEPTPAKYRQKALDLYAEAEAIYKVDLRTALLTEATLNVLLGMTAPVKATTNVYVQPTPAPIQVPDFELGEAAR